MSISAVLAVNDQMTNGIISTGLVNIKIDTYKVDNQGQKIKYDDLNKKVMPGDVVSIIPQISNLGAECYVRVKVNYINDNVDFINYVTGFSSELSKIGDYYYYKKALNSKEELKIFDTIKIPNNVNDLTNEKQIKLEVIAQAIQDKNFEPDYTLADPWKNLNPTDSVEDSYSIDTDKEYSKIDVKFQNDIKNDIVIPNDFFENLKNAMPGDVITTNIEIKNLNKKIAKYFLRFDTDDEYQKDIELLNKIHLTITNKLGQVLYNGKILKQENILLGEYSLNQSENLSLKVSIPADLSNEYIDLNPKVSIIFSADYKEKDIIKKKDTEDTTVNPKTGDQIDWAITIFIISAVGLIIVILLELREIRNIDSINNIYPTNGEKGEKDE